MTLSLFFISSSMTGPSTLWSKTSVNLFSGHGSPKNAFLELKPSGGMKIGSTVILKAFSNMFGISLASNGLESSRQGLVLTSITYSLNSSSIIKSRPNTSKVFTRLLGSSFPWHALKTSVVILLIYGNMSLSKQMFKSAKFLSR